MTLKAFSWQLAARKKNPSADEARTSIPKRFNIAYLSIFLLVFLFLVMGISRTIAHDQFVTNAQTPPCTPNPDNPRADGLVTAYGSISPIFANPSGNCITGPQAYVPINDTRFKVDNYRELVTRYFVQKSTNNQLFIEKHTSLPSATPLPVDGVELVRVTSSSVNIYRNSFALVSPAPSTTPAPYKSVIVFADGDINILEDIVFPSILPAASPFADTNSLAGLVLIAQGKINIDASVKQINAVLISDNVICTACDTLGNSNSRLASPTFADDDQLVINGSLIALNSQYKIKFARGFNDNRERPAEVIRAQAKYLILLKDAISDRIKIWSEL